MLRVAIVAALMFGASVSVATADEPPVPSGSLKWKQFARQVNGVHPVFTASSGNKVGLMWLNPQVLRFRLIPGTTAPEKSPVRAIDNRPSTWVPRLVAAFNGGFLLKDNPGGYFYNGRTVTPMVDGMGTLVFTKDGGLDVTVWRKGDHISKDVIAIRQNWEPLVIRGKDQSSANDSWYRWGGTDGKSPLANRSAVGQTNSGEIVYAFCAKCVAHDLGVALVGANVETAMILDMNKSWPNGFYYSAPKSKHGKPVGHRIHPGQWRGPTDYFFRGSKDIVVADAVKPAPAPEPTPAPTPAQ